MEIGLFAINYGTCADPEAAVRARTRRAAGFESVWTGEHIVLPTTPPEGFAIPSTLPFLDTVVALAAAHTTTIKVASGIIELPLHHPVSLAKQLASVDQVARGRLIVGIGAGYLEPEFAAMGVGLDERAGRMDEHLDAMRALWTMPQPEYHGRYVDFAGVDATRGRPVQAVRPSAGSAHRPPSSRHEGARLVRLQRQPGAPGRRSTSSGPTSTATSVPPSWADWS